MPATLEAVRPIALAEIEAARERIAGTIVRTPLVRLELGPGFPDIRLKLENLQPINAYKLRGRGQRGGDAVRGRAQARGLDDQRRQRRPGRGLCGAQGGRALHGGGDRDRAGLQARAHAGARRADWCRCPTRSPGRRSTTAPIPASRGPSSTRSTTTISSPATRRWAWRSWRTRRTRSAVIGGDRRRRADHRRRQRDQGAAAGDQGLGGRAGDRRARGAVASPRARRRHSRSGRPRSSTAPAARASSRACGSG